MSTAPKSNDDIARESSRAAVTLGQQLRDCAIESFDSTFQAAMKVTARSIERSYKETTLAAVFVVDYTSVVLKKFDDVKKRHLTVLILGNIETLRQIAKIGSLDHILSRLRPYSEYAEQDDQTWATTKAKIIQSAK